MVVSLLLGWVRSGFDLVEVYEFEIVMSILWFY
jgi:hypothetical protein